jgi:hypothetical protein
MKSLMKSLMPRKDSRNCCCWTKHQLSAVVNSTTDKPPAQGVHDSNHEGFMTLQPMLPVWLALPRRQGDMDGQNTRSWGSWL